MQCTQFDKLRISMKYYLIGRNYHTALKAYEFGREFHDGMRKDKITPEYQHQLEIAHFLRLFDDSPAFEPVLSASFLHDVREDFHISKEELIAKFGQQAYDIIWFMTKKYRKDKITNEEYYRTLADNRDAALLKGVDRINNIKSMASAFSLQKQLSYIEETEQYVLPMLKRARVLYPEYEVKFEHIKFVLQNIIEPIRTNINGNGTSRDSTQ